MMTVLCLMNLTIKVIAEWEHYALLELFNLQGFRASSVEIAMKLDLTANRTDVVINNLITWVSCRDLDGNLIKTYSDVRTTEDITSQALKDSHKETLNMGIKKLDEVEVEFRDFSSTTVAIDLNKCNGSQNHYQRVPAENVGAS